MTSKSDSDDKFAELVHRIESNGELVRTWKPEGGISAQVTAMEIRLPCGRGRTMLVRQHGEADRNRNSRIAADEFRLLKILRAAGLPTPAPYYLDESGEIFPDPYLVIEFMEGASKFGAGDRPDVFVQMATTLARIHSMDGWNRDLSFLPSQEERFAEILSKRRTGVEDSADVRRIRETLASVWPVHQRNRSALLHGDYWPGNLLWKDGRLVGVIDWEDAALGDPLADLANSRLEILWAFGTDAMQNITRHYVSMTELDATNLPYWDLFAALRPASRFAGWAPDQTTRVRMQERHHWFVSQALESLSVR